MNAKHTPGPWIAERMGKALYIQPASGGFVADMQRDECGNAAARRTCDADGVLIAASPGLAAVADRVIRCVVKNYTMEALIYEYGPAISAAARYARGTAGPDDAAELARLLEGGTP